MICSKFANEQGWTYFKNCQLVRHYSCRHLENKIWSARRLARRLLPAFLCAHIFIKRETSGYEADFHRCCKQVTMWCKSFTREKYMSFRMKWFFPPPFVPVSPFLLLNLVRRQCYAYAIGLYTRPEIKSWPDVKFCTHAQCVLPRCWYLGSAPF